MTPEVRFHGDGSLVALADGRLLVFVRKGLLTLPVLETLEGLKATVLASPKPKGVLAIFTSTAGVSNNALVERQRVFVRTIATEGRGAASRAGGAPRVHRRGQTPL